MLLTSLKLYLSFLPYLSYVAGTHAAPIDAQHAAPPPHGASPQHDASSQDRSHGIIPLDYYFPDKPEYKNPNLPEALWMIVDGFSQRVYKVSQQRSLVDFKLFPGDNKDLSEAQLSKAGIWKASPKDSYEIVLSMESDDKGGRSVNYLVSIDIENFKQFEKKREKALSGKLNKFNNLKTLKQLETVEILGFKNGQVQAQSQAEIGEVWGEFDLVDNRKQMNVLSSVFQLRDTATFKYGHFPFEQRYEDLNRALQESLQIIMDGARKRISYLRSIQNVNKSKSVKPPSSSDPKSAKLDFRVAPEKSALLIDTSPITVTLTFDLGSENNGPQDISSLVMIAVIETENFKEEFDQKREKALTGKLFLRLAKDSVLLNFKDGVVQSEPGLQWRKFNLVDKKHPPLEMVEIKKHT